MVFENELFRQSLDNGWLLKTQNIVLMITAKQQLIPFQKQLGSTEMCIS